MSIFNQKINLFLLIIIALYIIIYIISKIECKLCKINSFFIKNDKSDEKIKLVFISDFHNKKYKNGYNDLIDKIVNTNPDYIILGGDFVDFSVFQNKNNVVDLDNSLVFFNKLGEKFKNIKENKNYNLKRIFFVFGNHESRLKKRTDNENLVKIYKEFLNTLEKNDIELLDNTKTSLSNEYTISGLSLFDGYYSSLFKRVKLHKHIDQDIIHNFIDDIDENKFNIIAFHKPDYCEDLINYGFDLVLSGHNHGGLINFPIIGPIFSPDIKLFPKYNKGKYTYKNKNVIVSAGIGEHFIKIRVNNIPEICVININ